MAALVLETQFTVDLADIIAQLLQCSLYLCNLQAIFLLCSITDQVASKCHLRWKFPGSRAVAADGPLRFAGGYKLPGSDEPQQSSVESTFEINVAR